MKRLILMAIILVASISVNAQYYQLRYDSVRVVSKFKLGAVTTGASTDSLLTKKANGGVYKIAQSNFATSINTIQNQVASAQTGNFWINGSGLANNLEATTITAYNSLQTGALKTSVNNNAGSQTINNTQYSVFVNATSGANVQTLPTAGGVNAGLILLIKKVDATGNTVTIDGNGSETIDGATTQVISVQYKYIQIQSNGSNWYIIGQN